MLRVHAARYGGSEGARDFSVDDGEEAASVTEDRRRMETMDREEEDEGDFARLRNVHYLDHAGAAAFSSRAVLAAARELTSATTLGGGAGGAPWANPHSHPDGPASAALDTARARLARFCGWQPAQTYVVWVQNASAALRLIGDAFPFDTPRAALAIPRAAHTSVLALRAGALRRGADVCSYSLVSDGAGYSSSSSSSSSSQPGPTLVVLPAACNLSGREVSSLAAASRELRAAHGGDAAVVLVDLGATPVYRPAPLADAPDVDAAVLSCAKVVGAPTALGALLLRRGGRAERVLRKEFLGGGTVAAVSASRVWAAPHADLVRRFEDGTPPFLEAVTLCHGLDALERLGGPRAAGPYLDALRARLVAALVALRHSQERGGGRMALVVGEDGDEGGRPAAHQRYAPIVAVRVFQADGKPVGYAEVVEAARRRRIYVRGGCMCNAGACADACGWTDEEQADLYARGKVCGDGFDVFRGRHTGVVRVSFGPSSLPEDADAFVSLLADEYRDRADDVAAPPHPGRSAAAAADALRVVRAYIYPVKSCAALAVPSDWPMGPAGLRFDRVFQVATATGRALSSLQCPRLVRVLPAVDVTRGVLRLSYAGGDDDDDKGDCEVPLEDAPEAALAEAGAWLRRVLRRAEEVALVPAAAVQSSSSASSSPSAGSFAKSAPLLLINEDSVAELCRRLPPEFAESPEQCALRFRPNLVVGSPGHSCPFVEDEWCRRRQDGVVVTLPSAGGGRLSLQLRVREACGRCQSIGIHPTTGTACAEPLRTLRAFRRGLAGVHEFDSAVCFGVYVEQFHSE